VQEALTNVARHARAKHVRVELRHGDWMSVVVIEDDGIGFDPACTPKGRLGLIGMRERLGSAHGTLEIDSQSGRGTRLTVRLPLCAEGDHR
jgi:signal transduction histidine kinase